MTLVTDTQDSLTTIFESADMIALTERYYLYDLSALIQQSLADEYTVRALYKTEVNYFQALIKPFRVLGAATTVHQELQIEVSYTRQIDVAALNYQKVASAFDTFLQAMIDTVGYKWAGYINVYQVSQAPAVNVVTIAERDCWQSSFILNATI